MKYNMAISLSNHEDRIKKLESKPQIARIFYSGSENSGPGYGKTITLTERIRDFHIIVIEILTVDGYFHKFFYGPQFVSSTGNHKYDCTSNWNSQDMIVDLFPSIDGLSIRIAATNPNPNRFKGIHWIYGLKLYYNFSYNIYSLANSISFHFFKCLINSFKGGVKEIWQLV